MKKGLLLSLVASTVLFAGGDIAPVEPVAEAPVADCNDFYGHAGVSVVYNDNDTSVSSNETVTYGAFAVLGVTKEIFSGVTFNAEVQGGAFQRYDVATSSRTAVNEIGALTQFNLGYTWCNTAFKVGRFKVPASLSPLVASPTDYNGLVRTTFEGALVANTDLPDTTLWAAYLHTILNHSDSYDTGAAAGYLPAATVTGRNPVSIVAGGLRNTSFADAVITLAGYYDVTGDSLTDARRVPWTYMAAGSIDYKWCDTDISIGAAYRKYDTAMATLGDYDYMVGGYITQHFNSFDVKLVATYVADEDAAADNASNSIGYFKKYTDDTAHGYWNREGYALGAILSTDWCGYKLSTWGVYDEQKDYGFGVGVSKTFSGITFSTDGRYLHNELTNVNSQRFRAKAVYKF